ncbi:hypothetical protein FKM82_027445 [Ascaphus truei]
MPCVPATSCHSLVPVSLPPCHSPMSLSLTAPVFQPTCPCNSLFLAGPRVPFTRWSPSLCSCPHPRVPLTPCHSLVPVPVSLSLAGPRVPVTRWSPSLSPSLSPCPSPRVPVTPSSSLVSVSPSLCPHPRVPVPALVSL